MSPTAKRPPLPFAVRRLVWWFALMFVSPLAILVVPQLYTRLTAPNWWGMVLLMICIFTPVFLAIFIVNRSLHGIRRQYVASGGRLCTTCTHDLSGLGEHGKCPECGREFDIARDRLTWKRAMIGE